MSSLERGRKVLIVEDEPDLAATCARLVKRMGHMPLVSLDGKAAMTLIDVERPDLIVTDLRLPAASGLAVLRYARRCPRQVPVILFTAYASRASQRQALRAGAAAYLAKPYSAAELRAAVERALAPAARGPAEE